MGPNYRYAHSSYYLPVLSLQIMSKAGHYIYYIDKHCIYIKYWYPVPQTVMSCKFRAVFYFMGGSYKKRKGNITAYVAKGLTI
jgi:hypothetical protein